MTRFAGRTAIVTGGSRGIGRAIAQTLVSEGANVCITARKSETLDEAVRALGENAIGVAGKVDDPEHRDRVIDLVLSTFGVPDYLVNNVAVNPVYGRTIDTQKEAARKIFDVNVTAVLEWTRAAVESGMATRPGAAIANVSSVAATLPSPGIGMYGVSKASLEHLTRQLAFELAPAIRVNAVAPAVIKTEFSSVLYADREVEAAAQYPLKRLGETKDISAAVAFLLSDESSWITGQVIVVDGGLTLMGGI